MSSIPRYFVAERRVVAAVKPESGPVVPGGTICYAAPVKRWEAAARLVGLGWYVGICIVLGTLGGLWLDGKFHKGPLFAILGLLLGLVVASYGVYRMILPNIKGDRK